MKMKLQSEDNPLDARLESVLPGIYQWHQSTVSTLKSMGETINARLDDLSKQQKELAEQQNDFAERFSNKLIGLGLEIRGRTGATVPPLDELALLMGACQQSEKERPAASPNEERKLLEIRHETLEKMYNEWYGLGSFTDDEGGIAGRNQKYGSAWRFVKWLIHYSNKVTLPGGSPVVLKGKDKQSPSRTKTCRMAIRESIYLT